MLIAENVHVRLGSADIVRGVDLALAPGQIVALIGPNGAGKSTLLRAMAGELKLAAGNVRLHGRDVARMRPGALAAWRAVLGQSVAATMPFTAAEVVGLGLPADMRSAAAEAWVARGLTAVGMAAAAHRPVTRMSGGEQQRVQAARVLVQLWSRPADGVAQYLLLDEPTAHLDPAHQTLIAHLAREHAAGRGGVLAVLHDLNLAAAIADEIAILDGGRIVARGPPAVVLDPANLAAVYGVSFHVQSDGETTWVLPDLLPRQSRAVHVDV
jgi:iron complex transport system ATP-binding protein